MRVGRVITPIVKEIYERNWKYRTSSLKKAGAVLQRFLLVEKDPAFIVKKKFPLEEKEQAENIVTR